MADVVLLCIGIGVGGCYRDFRLRARCHIPASRLIGVVRLVAHCRNLICRQLQRITIMSGKGHGLVCCRSVAFALIPRAVYHLEGHRVRNKFLDLKFLVVGGKCRVCCLYAHIVCSWNKILYVTACPGSPVLGIRLFVLHRSRDAGEFAIVVVRSGTIFCCCRRRVWLGFCRRRGQRDRRVPRRRSGDGDLREAVARDGNAVYGVNSVILREVITLTC